MSVDYILQNIDRKRMTVDGSQEGSLHRPARLCTESAYEKGLMAMN